jgi:cyclase
MLSGRIIPCLLYDGAGLVKTVKFKSRVYVGDLTNAIKIFNDKEVDELIILDIDAMRQGREPDYRMIELAASQCFMPLCYGGGIRTLDQIRRILSLGIEKVSINTAAVEDPDLVSKAAAYFGSQAIVVSIDAKSGMFGGYSVQVSGGRGAGKLDPVEHARRVAALGAGEILITAIDRDGMMRGYDLDLVRSIVEAVDVPVIACGGAGSIDDLVAVLRKAGASAAAAGSLFVFYGPHRAVLISYPATDEVAKRMAQD